MARFHATTLLASDHSGTILRPVVSALVYHGKDTGYDTIGIPRGRLDFSISQTRSGQRNAAVILDGMIQNETLALPAFSAVGVLMCPHRRFFTCSDCFGKIPSVRAREDTAGANN